MTQDAKSSGAIAPPAGREGNWVSPFAAHLGLDLVEWAEGHAVVECLVGPHLTNTRGIAHGGVVSSLVDMACGASTSYQPSVGRRAIATVSLTVNYLKPVQVGDRLRAVGRRRSGKRIITCDVDVTNQDDVTVAVGLGTFCVVG